MIRNFRVRRGTGSLRYSAECGRFEMLREITVFMCEQKPNPVWFSCRRKSRRGIGGGGGTPL